MKARSHERKVGSSRRRVSKIAGARDTLAGFGKDVEVDVLTFGQFSIIDAIEALLEVTGPAAVTLATWTAAEFDLRQIQAQILRAGITDLRLIIDRSFVSRHPRFVRVIEDAFGAGCVRTTKTHAKFIVITNDAWNVVVRTSMNLNFNPRLEYLQVADDPELARFYLDVADALFRDEPDGMDSQRALPMLDSVDAVAPTPRIAMGTTPRTGR